MKPTPLLAALVLVAGVANPAFAANPQAEGGHRRGGPSATERAAWQSMSPEQRQAKMAEMRAAREAAMSPEQRAAHAARRAEWAAMSPDQREAKMAEMRARHGNRGPGGRPPAGGQAPAAPAQ